MTHYTDADAFLDTLAAAIESGDYRKSTFHRALNSTEWARLVAELADRSTPVKQSQLRAFQFIGILANGESKEPYTYANLSWGIKARLELVAFAREHVHGFLAPKH
ncbi:MAG TPA: hypothetical protein VIM12_04750 [Noviherbaspirillum sp.]|jgi:hypothetical protein|uniref:hypothetical protein n=1 Tax=Noviherbaspirillum sp. TaxID=1926288 RepID=UPI002F94C9FF